MTSQLLDRARDGDINAFYELFKPFRRPLQSYLYRLLADREEAADLAQETFVRSFDKIAGFKGGASLKTWVFAIATNLARDELRKRRRWPVDAQDIAREASAQADDLPGAYLRVQQQSAHGSYDIREHIDFCFTCIAKTLLIEQQVTLILKDIYAFSVPEIAVVLGRSQAAIKHVLRDARGTMTQIFDRRCALINKEGPCHQCSELNGLFNPQQNSRAEVVKLELQRAAENATKAELLELRAALLRTIDPLLSQGADLQDAIMQRLRKSIGELS